MTEFSFLGELSL